MTERSNSPRLGFFTSPPHECGYLADRNAVTLFADPRIPLSSPAYSWLSANGFRRSGSHVYRPHCGTCRACVAVRVVVDEFAPTRSQRRTLARNQSIEIRQRPARFEQEHFRLYEAYLRARHPDSQMDSTNPSAYMSFLTANWSDTSFYEFRDNGNLLAVAVVDHLVDGLSAVYTFFSPQHAGRSLGRFAVLKQIEWAASAGLPWVYLGYWIQECRKMSYKREYAPLEFFERGSWQRNIGQ
jgi:leucyl-tRNA---protein transferase